MVRKKAVDAHVSTDPKFHHWKSRFKAATGAFEMGMPAEARTLVYRSMMEAEGLKDSKFAVPVCQIGLAVISMEQGKQKEAKEFFEKGLRALEHQTEEDAQEAYAAGLRFFAIWHEQNGDLTEAENCLRQSVNILKEFGQESAVQFAYSLSDLCYVLIRNGKLEEAETLIPAALGILNVTVGEDDPTYDWAKMIYRICLNKNDEALWMENFEASVNHLQLKVGEKNPNLVRALNAYAEALKKRGLTEKLESMKENFAALLKA